MPASGSAPAASSDSSAASGPPAASVAPVPRPTSVSAAESAGTATGAGPTAAELLDFVRRVAADPATVASLPLAPEDRTWVRLDGPGGSEAWLIGWPPGTGTGWHDHADSVGAFTTATGTLREHSLAARLPTDGWKTLELTEGIDRSRELPTGRGRAFGRHHVHEVLNESATEHAVSVHAYYPPLPRIRRYSRAGDLLRLEQIEQPEDWR
ncbi:cysteine dioxygenase [Streptomyces sp. NPDC052095]|uniref:cysteine dioxygenase n=1 Tax=unclassified Streptomyces TaxID=2593676 RepID=UPI00344D3F61